MLILTAAKSGKIKNSSSLLGQFKMIETIKEKLLTYISKNLYLNANANINFSTPLISSGTIDSFGLIDLSLFVEDEFKVEINDTELSAATFDSIDQLANIIWIRQTQRRDNQ